MRQVEVEHVADQREVFARLGDGAQSVEIGLGRRSGEKHADAPLSDSSGGNGLAASAASSSSSVSTKAVGRKPNSSSIRPETMSPRSRSRSLNFGAEHAIAALDIGSERRKSPRLSSSTGAVSSSGRCAWPPILMPRKRTIHVSHAAPPEMKKAGESSRLFAS
jgi:hypothetical protein